MASSEIALCNAALRRIGQKTIASLTDPSELARTVNDLYSEVRDQVLSIHPWNCATRRASLALLADAPPWGFSKAFALPADFLRLVRSEYADDLWRMETIARADGTLTRAIVTDLSQMRIVYIARIADVTLMDAFVQRAIEYRLAAEIADRITGSQEKRQAMESLYRDALDEARFQDSRTAPPTDDLRPSAFLGARIGGGTLHEERRWSNLDV